MTIALTRLTWWLEKLLMVVAGVVVVAMLLHICLGMAFRAASVSLSISTLTVVSAWYMVAVTFLPMPLTNRHPGHLSADLVARFFPFRLRCVSEALVALVSCLYFLVVGYLTLCQAIHQTAAHEVWETAEGFIAVWPGRWAPPVAFLLMALREALRLVSGQFVAVASGREASA